MFQEFLIKTKSLPFDVKDTQDFEEVWIELLKQIYTKSDLEFLTFAEIGQKDYLVMVSKQFMIFLESEFVLPSSLDEDIFRTEREIYHCLLYYYSGRYPSFIMFPFISLEVKEEGRSQVEEDMDFIEKNYLEKVLNKEFKEKGELFSITDIKMDVRNERFYYNVAQCLKKLPDGYTINLYQFALILKLLFLVGRNEKIEFEVYEKEVQYKGTQPFIVLKTENKTENNDNNDFCHFAILFPIDMEFIK